MRGIKIAWGGVVFPLFFIFFCLLLEGCAPGMMQGEYHTDGSPDYRTIARQDAIAVQFPADVFVRQIQQESGFNPNAVSPAGAIGIAQFMPATAQQLGVDPYDPIASLRGAALLMARYTQRYGGDIVKALAAYNAGPGCVDQAIVRDGVNWREGLPSETRFYLSTILT